MKKLFIALNIVALSYSVYSMDPHTNRTASTPGRTLRRTDALKKDALKKAALQIIAASPRTGSPTPPNSPGAAVTPILSDASTPRFSTPTPPNTPQVSRSASPTTTQQKPSSKRPRTSALFTAR